MTEMTERQFRKLRLDPAAFRSALMIDAGGVVRPFVEVVEAWQVEDFEALDPAWRRMVHRDESIEPTHTRAWIERPRGHSKSTDEAAMVLWALFASDRAIRGVAAAADKDQARILRDAIEFLIRLNTWLSEVIEVQRDCIINKHTGARLDIIASDVASSYGLLLDFVIADEVTQWQKGDMWDSLISTAAKKANCVFIVLTNAGLQDSWQANVRKIINESAQRWYFHALDGPKASWISEEFLEEQRLLLLSGPAFERLWLNRWSSGGGDALTRDVIDAAFDPDANVMTGKELGWKYAVGIDLGVKRDASAVVVLATEPYRAGSIRLAYAKTYRPSESSSGKVDLQQIELDLIDIHRKYKPQAYAFDPWNCELLAQRLEMSLNSWRDSPYFGSDLFQETPPTAENLREQAALTIQLFNDRRLSLYECADLRRDLNKLRVEEKSYGYRLTSPRDATGHGDTFSAFALALPHAYKLSGQSRQFYYAL